MVVILDGRVSSSCPDVEPDDGRRAARSARGSTAGDRLRSAMAVPAVR
jgi:hypothetical protein